MDKDPARHPVDDPGTAGVIARPPLLFLAALLLGLLFVALYASGTVDFARIWLGVTERHQCLSEEGAQP